MARFLGTFQTSHTFFVNTTSLIGSNGFLLCEAVLFLSRFWVSK